MERGADAPGVRRVGTLGVVLAGGRGARLGGRAPKALAELAGRTLLDRAIALAFEVCDEVVVAAPAELDLPVPRAMRADDASGAGPLAGIVAGLASRAHERALAIAIDLPLLGAPLLRELLARLPGRTAVIPVPGGVPQPLAAAYGPEAATRLARRLAEGERSVIAAVRSLDPLWVGDADLGAIAGGAFQLLNVNTPADLAEAERAVAERSREGT